jgi:hypothetical protein
MLIAGWSLATVLALILGLQAVSAISASVATHPKASLSPDSVRAALDRSSSSTESSSSSSSSGESAASSDATIGASSANDDRGGQQVSSAVDAASPSGQTASESAASSATAPAEDRTYQLVGGSVGVRFENGEAHLLWATPNTGFSVDASGSSSDVDVRFRSDSHESQLKAYWDGGPQREIEENPR